MRSVFTLLLLVFVAALRLTAQKSHTENVVIVTLDGMRWQEVFGGMDTAIANQKNYNLAGEAIHQKFWSNDVQERRKKLFPFFWNTIAKNGQLYGNRNLGSLVNNANPYKFSYPGYNEIFTGYPDTAVNSNDRIYNKNENVLEFINKQPGFTGKVAAFSTWGVFPYILNEPRSLIYVNADTDTLAFNNPALQLINNMQELSTRPIGVRPDVFTYFAAKEYLKAYQPKVLYIAFDETDDFAHAGMYDQYLGSAHAEDNMIADLWNTLQSLPAYKGKTTLLVTCDHGRGDAIKDQWRDHGEKIEDAGQLWIAVLGPETAPLGELKQMPVIYQAQLAATIAQWLGYQFSPKHPIYPPIPSLIK